jgi:nucleoside-diphosphate-sugar epimerase
LKRIIVTGHNGYIGSLLRRILADREYEVIGIDTNFFDKECDYSVQPPLKKELIKDIREIEETDIEGAFAVCHLAALSNDPMGELNEKLTFEINYQASLRLARLAKKCGIERFCYSSSCSMYGIADGSTALDETAPFSPVTTYAKSKVLAENELRPLADDRFCVTSLRNATAYGISPKFRFDLVVNNLIGWAVTSGEIRIMSDGSPWRPLIHAEDIARAFIAVLEAPKETVNGHAFNIGVDSENYQVKTIAEMIGKIVPGCKLLVTGEHGCDSRSYRVDFRKVKNALPGFRPGWNLEEGIRQIVESLMKGGMDRERFAGRFFSRLKQLKYLMETGKINSELYWL